MKNFMVCRRTFICVLGIAAMTVMALVNHVDVSMAMAGMIAALCGANAYEKGVQTKGADKYVGGA